MKSVPVFSDTVDELKYYTAENARIKAVTRFMQLICYCQEDELITNEQRLIINIKLLQMEDLEECMNKETKRFLA